MTDEEMVYYLEHADVTVGQKCKTKTAEAIEKALKIIATQPKRGKWIVTNDYVTTAYGSLDYYRCSYCGEDSLEEGNFCPNCGADMREVQE